MPGTFTAVMDDGTLVEARSTLNIIGATITDNATANRTDVAINSPDGDMTLAANKSLIGTAGTGALTLGSMTGATQLPTGNLGWAGASTKTLSLVSTAATVTIKSTTSGAVLVDSAGVLNLGTTDSTSSNIGKTGTTTTVKGVLQVDEAANLNGNVTLGNATTDVLTFSAPIRATATGWRIADPGNAGAVPVTGSGVCALTTAGAETRTVAIPTFVGQRLTLSFDVDGGDAVITFASAFNRAGNTIVTYSDAGEYSEFVGIQVAGTRAWAIVANDGGVLS